MKKLAIFIVFQLLCYGGWYLTHRLGVLPSETNYLLVSDGTVYRLTKNGLSAVAILQSVEGLYKLNIPIMEDNFFRRMVETKLIDLRDPDQPSYYRTYEINNHQLLYIVFWPTGDRVYLYNLVTERIDELEVADYIFDRVTANPDELLFYSRSKANRALLYNLRTGTRVNLKLPFTRSSNLIWSKDSSQVIYVEKGSTKIYHYSLITKAKRDLQLDGCLPRFLSSDSRILILIEPRVGKVYSYNLITGQKHDLQLDGYLPKILGATGCDLILFHPETAQICHYDLTTGSKKDLPLVGYFPLLLAPTDQDLFLAHAKTDKLCHYNLRNGAKRLLNFKKASLINMLWLPDRKGFLYTDTTIEELIDFITAFSDRSYGLYYYSLAKGKSIRLAKFFYLNQWGGCILPANTGLQNIPGLHRIRSDSRAIYIANW